MGYHFLCPTAGYHLNISSLKSFNTPVTTACGDDQTMVILVLMGRFAESSHQFLQDLTGQGPSVVSSNRIWNGSTVNTYYILIAKILPDAQPSKLIPLFLQ